MKDPLVAGTEDQPRFRHLHSFLWHTTYEVLSGPPSPSLEPRAERLEPSRPDGAAVPVALQPPGAVSGPQLSFAEVEGKHKGGDTVPGWRHCAQGHDNGRGSIRRTDCHSDTVPGDPFGVLIATGCAEASFD